MSNVAVILNHVPDTEAVIKIDGSDGSKINSEDLKFILNPYDEYAVEEAIEMADELDGESIAICIGDNDAETTIRYALAMGIDRAVLINEPKAIEIDPVNRGKVVAAAIKDLDAKVILTGRETIDLNEDSMATVIAGAMDLPQINYVSKIDFDGDTLKVVRDIEGGSLEVNSSFPVVLSAQKGLNDPRYPSLIKIKRAKKKEIKEVTIADLGVDFSSPKVKVVKLNMPPARAQGIMVNGDAAEVSGKCVSWLSDTAKII